MLPDHQLLANIYDQAFSSIAITNSDIHDIRFEYINPAFLQLTGYSEDEIIGKSPKMLQGELTKRDEIYRLKEACLKGENFKGENINYKKDGTTYWVEWIVSPIKDENGKIINFLSIQKDITNEKKLEEKLIQNTKLNTLYSISAGLTHELNTALTTLKGSSELLKLDIDTIDDEKKVKTLNKEITRLNKSIGDIINITNSLHYLTNTSIKLEHQINIFDLLLDSLNIYKEKIERYTTCTINGHNAFDQINDVHFTEYYANIQKESIRHVFIIIIDNALDELMKTNDKVNNLLNIEITQNSYSMTIDFIDNAGGIIHSNISKIFNPFFKQKELGGLGIGLHVAKNIMKDNNGDIEAFSKPPYTTMRVTLPL